MTIERRTFSGKGTNWGDGTFAGRIKCEFRFWETPCWLWTGWMEDGKNDKPKFRAEVHKTQILLDQTDIVLMSDHLEICQHIYRDWNGNADHLTHQAREDGPAWNAFQAKERIEASVSILMAMSAMKKTRRSRTEYVQDGSSRLLKR